MGADFVAVIPSESIHVSYGHVFRIKARLAGLVDKRLEEKWMRIASSPMELGTKYAEEVLDEIESQLGKGDDMLVTGVLTFVGHSDCDGEFGFGDLESVSYALKKLNEKEGGEDKAIESLINVFDDAISGDGCVQIW